jgi:hypothetical protein
MPVSRKGFWVRVFADWPAKVLSIAAALLMFFFYRLNRLEDRFVSVPLSVTVNDEFVPSNALPRSVRLALRGESSSLFSVLEDDLRASVDLSAARGEGLVHSVVVVEKKGSALGIDPLEVRAEPSEVAANLERKARKTVAITPSFRGYLAPGYELATFDLNPAEAEVQGPASAVARVIDLSTDFIELTGRTSDFSAEVRLFSKDPFVGVSGRGQSTFKATVQQAIEYKRFDGVPIAIVGLVEGLALGDPPPSGALRLQSSKAQLRGFALPEGILYIDCAGVRRAGVYTLPVSARLPEGFALDSIDPESVTIRVTAAGGGTR